MEKRRWSETRSGVGLGLGRVVDLAFGLYVKFGTIIKEYRNANMIYTPSEMVGTKRTGVRGIEGRNQRTIRTSHVERMNGTQGVLMKRQNRLTLCFSKKLRTLEAAFAMFAAYYNFCPQAGQEWSEARNGRDDGRTGRTVQAYSKNDLARANDEYTKAEESAREDKSKEVVLVSAGRVRELRKVYPNYFLDTEDFVGRVTAIIKESKRQK